MKPLYILIKSDKPQKKYMIITPTNKIIHFGANEKLDFILSNGDKQRRKMYLLRHAKREDWNDLKTAGAWSRWILWEKPALKQAIINMEKIFNIDILYISH